MARMPMMLAMISHAAMFRDASRTCWVDFTIEAGDAYKRERD